MTPPAAAAAPGRDRADEASPRDSASPRPRVLLVASGGGHWVQLLRLRPAFEGCEPVFVCVRREYAVDVAGHEFRAVNDATRWNKFGLLLLALRMLVIVARLRPQVVVSTGAAPGYFALRIGKLFGARTVWIDSIANVERLSMTGVLARKYADLWLTQWPHLAQDGGPSFAGSVL